MARVFIIDDVNAEEAKEFFLPKLMRNCFELDSQTIITDCMVANAIFCGTYQTWLHPRPAASKTIRPAQVSNLLGPPRDGRQERAEACPDQGLHRAHGSACWTDEPATTGEQYVALAKSHGKWTGLFGPHAGEVCWWSLRFMGWGPRVSTPRWSPPCKPQKILMRIKFWFVCVRFWTIIFQHYEIFICADTWKSWICIFQNLVCADDEKMMTFNYHYLAGTHEKDY